MKPKLSSRQRIIRFLIAFAPTYGYPPTMSEIAAALDFNSVESVRYHVKALRAAGTIEWQEGNSRTIALREPSAGLVAFVEAA